MKRYTKTGTPVNTAQDNIP